MKLAASSDFLGNIRKGICSAGCRSYSALPVVLLCVSMCLGFSGCSSHSSSPSDGGRASFRSPTSGGAMAKVASVEIESSEQESLLAIKRQPLEFELKFPEATYAWDRVRAFFLQFTGSFAVEPIPQTGAPDSLAMMVSNRLAAADQFIFEVRRSTGKKGARFSVAARGRATGTSASEIRLQAQNLARFVQTGTLDASLTPPRSAR